MAELVVGIGTSHTPQVSMGADMWAVHAQRVDSTLVDMEKFSAVAPPWMSNEIDPSSTSKKYEACQEHIGALSDILNEASPDIVVVFGDDHREVFQEDCTPALAVHCGNEAWDLPSREEDLALPSIRASDWAYHGQEPVKYALAGEFGGHVVRHLKLAGMDPSVVAGLGPDRFLGHAFTFVTRRLAPPARSSMLPIWLNAFYAPNQLSAERSYLAGQSVRAAIESWPGSERVAIVASGGLSHYVVDTEFDLMLLGAIKAKDASILRNIRDEQLESGTGEVRMWVAAAGALENLSLSYCEYLAGYRSIAGTGVGLGFAAWT
jgi:3-O-methylgallate 3,4-dioxygenase